MNTNLLHFSKQLQNGEITPDEIYQNCIEQITKLNPKLNVFLRDPKQKSIEKDLESATKRWKQNKQLSNFDGIPIGIKDNIALKGQISSCASKLLEQYRSPFSATVIKKLQSQGMICVGSINMDEFAMGSSTEYSAFGPSKNPYDTTRVPGGSSGGSAVAVRTEMLPVALGSDTGGSIRQPASFCGTIGLKPTYGTVSRYGLIAFASSLDQIGPFGNTTIDVKTIYNIIKGHDPKDSTSVPQKLFAPPSQKELKNIRIGVPTSSIEQCSLEIQKSFNDVLEFLKSNVLYSPSQIQHIDLPHQEYAVPTYYIIAQSEASANLSRFDGVRYGTRTKQPENLAELFIKSRSNGFGTEVKRRIMLGTFALSKTHYDAYYTQAQKVRALIQQDYLHAFKTVDVIMLPTTTETAFKFGEKTKDVISMYQSDLSTVSASLAGIPAISIPSPSQGTMPIGVQLQASFFQEELLFRLGQSIEQQFPQTPPNL